MASRTWTHAFWLSSAVLPLLACGAVDAPPHLVRIGSLMAAPATESVVVAQDLRLSETPLLLPVEIDAVRITALEVRARGTATMLRLAWRLADEGEFKPFRHLSFPLLQDGSEHSYKVNLRREPSWMGEVTLLALSASGGQIEVVEIVGHSASSPYRSMALGGTSMPSIVGVSESRIPLPGDLPREARFECHLGLLPEYDKPGVRAHFRVSSEVDGRREIWLDRVIEGGKEGGPRWHPVQRRVAVPRGGDLLLEAAATRDGQPLLDGTALWGNPLLVGALPPERKSLVLIIIDTLRADAVGAYGDEHGLTPHLDSLASRSIRFAQLYAPAPWTLPSVASLLSGLQPQTHGAGRRAEGFAPTGLSEPVQTLAEALAEEGYYTVGIYHNIYLDPSFGLQQGFDRYAAYEERAGFLVDRALEVLARQDDGPIFLYLHLFDPHNPYEPPADECEGVARRLQPGIAPSSSGCFADRRPGRPIPDGEERLWFEALYQAEVAYTDRELGRFLQTVEQERNRGTVVAVVSDHGEEFWERLSQEEAYGYQLDGDHGHTHYRELLQLVGLIRDPDSPPQVIQQPVEMVDLFATLLSLLDIPAPPNQGRNLTPAFGGGRLRRASLISDFLLHGDDRWAIQRGPWKLVVSTEDPDSVELYRLTDDPDETHDVATQHADIVEGLRQLGLKELEKRRQDRRRLLAGETALSATYLEWSQITKLRTLGYLK